MLKGSNNKPKIINAEYNNLIEVYEYLKGYDAISKFTMSKEFYYVFLDKKKYTMFEIANLTGNSESTLRRHIRKFNDYLQEKSSKK